MSLGREGRAVPCAQKPTALVRGPLQNCRSSTKHRLAARAQAAMGRPAVGQQQEAPAERSPLQSSSLSTWAIRSVGGTRDTFHCVEEVTERSCCVGVGN